jgi:predicted regulator of Ras-like GTPase activity (Roadblock/LC7/MglB family)
MSDDIKTLFNEVRADMSDDFIAMDIVGQDGISIAREAVESEFNDQLASAHFAMVMKLADRLSSSLNMGKAIENQFTTDAFVAISRTLGDGSFYWLLVAKAQANIGLLRAVMDQYELRLWGAIPS